MSKLILFFKKFALVAIVLAIGLAALPASDATAASLNDVTSPPASQPDNSRLEHIWVHIQAVYQRQSERLAKADEFTSKVQALLDKANQKGWDTSLVQAALNAFASVIPEAQAVHDNGEAIIVNHTGFDTNGKVTDRTAAINTVKALSQILKDTRAAMDGTGRALREAIRAFREEHRPNQAPATTTP